MVMGMVRLSGNNYAGRLMLLVLRLINLHRRVYWREVNRLTIRMKGCYRRLSLQEMYRKDLG
jgi:hypothetical protein